MEVFFAQDSLAPTGEALTAGKLTPAESPFNLGIVPSGQEKSRMLVLRHVSGNQGVLVSGVKIAGDPAYQVRNPVVTPYLIKSGGQATVEVVFVSKGAIPGESFLEVTLAVPAGVIVKVPLEANKTALDITKRAQRADLGTSTRSWEGGGWIFEGRVSRSGDGSFLRDLRDAKGSIRKD
jgi:hypothetical protein